MDTDERRKLTLKRKLQSLEQDQDTLFNLLKVLGGDEDINTVELLHLIRSKAALDEIRLYVANKAGNLPDNNTERPSLNQLPDNIHALLNNDRNTRRKVMDTNRLCDITLFRVPGPCKAVEIPNE